MKRKKKFQWLKVGSTGLCGKSCLAEYCKVHLVKLRKGPGTKQCTGCGKRVKNRYLLCQTCGYGRLRRRYLMRGFREIWYQCWEPKRVTATYSREDRKADRSIAAYIVRKNLFSEFRRKIFTRNICKIPNPIACVFTKCYPYLQLATM